MRMRRLLYLLSFITVFSCCIVISTVQARANPSVVGDLWELR